MIKFKCSQCQKAITAADEHAGRKAKCPGCHTILVIPKPGPPPAPIKLDHVEVVDEEDGAPPPPPRKATPKPAPKPAPKQASPAIKAGKPRREEYAEDEEDIPEVEAVEEEDFEVVEEEEEERPRKRRRVVVAEEDEEEEERRPRKKRRKKKGRWHGEWAECPNCGAPGDAYRLYWTWWGGMIGPLFICHVRCNRCGTTYNGKSGDSNTTRIIIYYAVNLGIGLLFFICCFGLGMIGELSKH
jgi:DNA-directed RNA polymerase subunit RPC12/RpoP